MGVRDAKNFWKNSTNWSILGPFWWLFYALGGVRGWVGGNHQNIDSSGSRCYLKTLEKVVLNDFIEIYSHKLDRNTIGPSLYKPVLVWKMCIGFSQHGSCDYFSKKKKWLDFSMFRDVLGKILYFLTRKQKRLDGLIFRRISLVT